MWMFVLWEKGDLSGLWGQGSPNPLTNNSRKRWSSGLALGAEQGTSLCTPYPNLRSAAPAGIPTAPISWLSHPKIQVGADVLEEASDHGSQVDDVGGFVPLKQGFGLGAAPGMGNFGDSVGSAEKIRVFPRKNPVLGGEILGFSEGRLGGF